MSVIFSSNIALNTNPVDVANRPRILVDNVFQQGTVTASSENSATNGWLENAVDGGTYDWWQWTSTPAWLEVTLTTAATVDMGAIGLHTGLTFVFQYWNGSEWVNLHEAVTTTTTSVYAVIFEEVTASKFRIYISDAQDEKILGIVMLGKSLQFPKTFYGGHAPITLNRTAQLVRNKTEAGFDAGVYSLRTGAATSVEINNCKPGWIRDNLEDLNKKLEICPFIFAWRPSTFPNDVAYCWLNSPIRANNSGPRDLMTLQFDVNAFVGGGIVAPIIERLLIGMNESPYLGLYVDAETQLILDSSPVTAPTVTSRCNYVDIHQKGVVASAYESDGIYVYEYSNGNWDLIPGPSVGGKAISVNFHPDNANWMLATYSDSTETPTVRLFKRTTKPDGANGYYLHTSLLMPGRNVAIFSPDGQLVFTCGVGVFYIGVFDADLGEVTSSASYATYSGKQTISGSWSDDSEYLAVLTIDRSGIVYKRDKYTNALTSIGTFYSNISSGLNFLYDSVAWNRSGTKIAAIREDNGITIATKADDDTITYDFLSNLIPGFSNFKKHSVDWSQSGNNLYIGQGGGTTDNFIVCYFDEDTGAFSELYDQAIPTSSNDISGLKSIKIKGSLPQVLPDIEVIIAVYDSSDIWRPIAKTPGTYTIRPIINVTPNVGSIVSAMQFYVDDISVGVVFESPFEVEIDITALDNMTTKVIKVEMADLYGNLTTQTLDYEINSDPFSVLNFTPAAWFDASDSGSVTLSGSDVMQWDDKSGNGFDASENGNPPTISPASLNGLDTIAFNNDLLDTATFSNPSGATGVSVFMVAKNTSYLASNAIPLIKGALNTQWSYYWPSSTDIPIFRNTTSIEVLATSAISTSWHVFGGLIADAGRSIRLDGTEEGTGGEDSIDFGSDSSLYIGGASTPGYGIDGSIAEIIIVNSTLSVFERQQFEGYLAWKWGLQDNLPAQHPYKGAAP